MDDRTLLETLDKSTSMLKGSMWRDNFNWNLSTTHFHPPANELENTRKGEKAVIIAAGPAFKAKGLEILDKIYDAKPRPFVIACDGALRLFDKSEHTPDVVVSIDGDPIVAKFYEAELKRKHMVLLATTIHRSVVTKALERGYSVYWFQSPMPKELQDINVINMLKVFTGGNVGTTSSVLAWGLFGCRPIGLLGIEFAWSDETPYYDTQYYPHLKEALHGDEEKIKKQFVTLYNPWVKKKFIADPVYYAYSVAFKGMWDDLPADVKQGMFTLTPEGIICKTGITYKPLETFLEMT